MVNKFTSCEECPWIKVSQHNQKWPNYVDKMVSSGIIKNKNHSCHMKTKDIWGLKGNINDNNICVGSLKEKDNG